MVNIHTGSQTNTEKAYLKPVKVRVSFRLNIPIQNIFFQLISLWVSKFQELKAGSRKEFQKQIYLLCIT